MNALLLFLELDEDLERNLALTSKCNTEKATGLYLNRSLSGQQCIKNISKRMKLNGIHPQVTFKNASGKKPKYFSTTLILCNKMC